MEETKDLNDLVYISRHIGSEPSFVQGGGGNTSVKSNDNKMAIKASGARLKDMSLSSGYSIVNYSKINNFIQTLLKSEYDYSGKVNGFSDTSFARPSIETGFHSILGKFVIHTHSVYVNTLTCSKEGKNILDSLFPEYYWADYATPGLDLMMEIKNIIPFPAPKIGALFLQNHGVIVWADDAKTALKIHNDISLLLIKKFNLKAFKANLNISQTQVSNNKEILFPDQIIYTMSDSEGIDLEEVQEIHCSYNYILTSINQIGLTPSFLQESESMRILGMESEKYRLKVINKE